MLRSYTPLRLDVNKEELRELPETEIYPILRCTGKSIHIFSQSLAALGSSGLAVPTSSCSGATVAQLYHKESPTCGAAANLQASQGGDDDRMGLLISQPHDISYHYLLHLLQTYRAMLCLAI